MNLLEELRTLDPKQPGNWPWPIKATAFLIIFILIQVGAYFAFWAAQADVGYSVTLKCRTRRRLWASTTKTKLSACIKS